MLDTGRLAGIGHEPVGAPVAEVGAGTPLRAVQATLERTGQRLAVDAPSPGATLGGVLAADEAGPLRHRHGSPCDQLLGVALPGRRRRAGQRRRRWRPGSTWPGCSAARRARSACWSRRRLRVQPVPASRLWVSRPVWTPLEVHDLVRAILAADSNRPPSSWTCPAGPPRPRTGRTRRATPAATARERHPSMSGRAGAPSRAGSLVVLLEGGPADVTERAERLVGLLRRGGGGHPLAAAVVAALPVRPGRHRAAHGGADQRPARRRLRAARRGRRPGAGARLGRRWAWCTRRCPARCHPTGWRRSWPPSAGCCWPGGAGAWWSPRPRRSAGPSTSGVRSPAWPSLRAAKEHLDPDHRLAPGRLPGGL